MKVLNVAKEKMKPRRPERRNKKRKEKKPSGFYCSTKKQQQKKKEDLCIEIRDQMHGDTFAMNRVKKRAQRHSEDRVPIHIYKRSE